MMPVPVCMSRICMLYEGSISRKINTQFAIAKEYTHRGFIKNQAGVGYVSGNLSFYSKA